MTMWVAKGPVSDSDLYEIDPTDASTISIGAIGEGVTGMAIDPSDGTLYGVTSNSSTNPRYLITIDKNTGAGSIVGQLLQGGVARTIADIGFDDSGQLWGFNVSQSRICKINKLTGAITNIGSTVLSGQGNGIDLDWQNNLFWLGQSDDGLLKQVDTTTGSPTDINTLNGTISGRIPAACFSGNKFFAIVNDTQSWLATIAWTGTVTYIGQTTLDSLDAIASDTTKTQWYSPPITVNAEDYANLSSSTVSLQIGSPQWVRDVQYRKYDFTNFNTSKGTVDYTHTLIIPAGEIPSGRYKLEIYAKYGSIGGVNSEPCAVQLRQGQEMPMNPPYGNGFFADPGDGTALWLSVTDESGLNNLNMQGGALYVDASQNIYLDIGQWSENESSVGNGKRYLEVQKIKFTPLDIASLPASRWILMKDGGEPWGFMLQGQTRMREKEDGSGFYISGHFFNNVSNIKRFTIWEYAVNGDEITLVDSKGLGDVDLKETSTGAIFWHDFTVMPNGDIYLIAFEQGTISEHRTWIKHWNGSSWNTITGDLAGHAAGSHWWQYSCSIDNDGSDIYVAWGEHKTGSQNYASEDWGIRIKKYDIGGASFTELGTSSGNGISAWPSEYSDNGVNTTTNAGNGEYPVKLRVSPGGVPWIAWHEFRPNSTTNPDKNDKVYVLYWDGSAWQDISPDVPNNPPSGITGHSYSTTPSGAGNYVRVVADNVDGVDMTFCHADGPNEYPSICHQWVWADQTGSFDYATFVYKEFNGSVWGNEIQMDSLSQWPSIAAFNTTLRDAGLLGQHWHGGFSLDDDGSVPYLFAQLASGTSSLYQVAAAKCLPDGSAFKSLGGDEYSTYENSLAAGVMNFVDTPASPGPLDNGGNWEDSCEAGVIVNGRAIGGFHWRNGWQIGGFMCTIWKPAGIIDLTRVKFRSFSLGDS